MEVVRLSALRTGLLYLPGNIPGTYFCKRLSRIMSGIAFATFRLVAQYLNQLHHRVTPLQFKELFLFTSMIIFSQQCKHPGNGGIETGI
jgi:hypothetical protein